MEPRVPHLEVHKVRTVGSEDLADKPITIGRSSSNALVLPDNRVSRRHCVIEMVDGAPVIRDLNSTKGTFVNGQRITEMKLAHGDRILIRPFEIVFEDPQRAKPVLNGEARHTSNGLLESRMADDGELAREHAATLDRMIGLEGELAESRKKEDSLAEKLKALEADYEKAMTLLADTESSLLDARSQCISAEQRFDQLQAEHARMVEQSQHQELSLESLHLQLHDASAKLRTLEDRLQNIDALKRDEINRLQTLLMQRDEQVERLRAHEATLQQQTEALEIARRAALEKAGTAGRAILAIQDQATALEAAAQRVSRLQSAISAVEAQWTEIDDQLEQSDDAEQVNAAAARQAEITEQIELLSQQRDAAVSELNNVARRMEAIACRNGFGSVPLLNPWERASAKPKSRKALVALTSILVLAGGATAAIILTWPQALELLNLR